MKKLFPVAAVAALALMFTSCKKNYTCECDIAGTPKTWELGKQKKKDAEAACKNLQVTSTVTCKLK